MNKCANDKYQVLFLFSTYTKDMNHHATVYMQSQSQIEFIITDLPLKLIFNKSFWKCFQRFRHVSAASPWHIPHYKLWTRKYQTVLSQIVNNEISETVWSQIMYLRSCTCCLIFKCVQSCLSIHKLQIKKCWDESYTSPVLAGKDLKLDVQELPRLGSRFSPSIYTLSDSHAKRESFSLNLIVLLKCRQTPPLHPWCAGGLIAFICTFLKIAQ